MSGFEIERKAFTKNLALITGLTRSGKSMLGPIVSSFEGAENVRLNYLMELVPPMNKIELITEDVAIYLMRHAVDFMLYDNMIGRNSNFRPSDYTSIWRTKNPAKYFQRLFRKEGDLVFDELMEKNIIFVLMFHNGPWFADILFKAFPDMKMLYVKRNPVDVVSSWYKKGYGTDFYAKPRNGLLTIKWKGRTLPFYSAGWEEEYCSLGEVDRIVFTINKIEMKFKETLHGLSDAQRENIMEVCFERMVTKPDMVIPEVCRFLGTNETAYTPRVLKQELCPRVLREKDQEEKFNKIKENCSSKAADLLGAMVKGYKDNAG